MSYYISIETFQVESRYYGDGEDAYAMKRNLTTFLATCEEEEKKLEQQFAKLTLGKEDAAIVNKVDDID